MNEIAHALKDNVLLFANQDQAVLYVTLLREGPLGTEKLHQITQLHREMIDRELRKMEKTGTVTLIKNGRNKKAHAISIAGLQDILDQKNTNFNELLKPLLEAENNRKIPKLAVYMNDQAFGLLQMKLIKLQPKDQAVRVISTHPREWLAAMLQSRKLSRFETVRLEKEIPFMLSCFSERRGEVEFNNREYFAAQPEKLKRQYRYVETSGSSPMQIQIWFHCIVISLFESAPSIHIVIDDLRIVKAMNSYFQILWSIGVR